VWINTTESMGELCISFPTPPSTEATPATTSLLGSGVDSVVISEAMASRLGRCGVAPLSVCASGRARSRNGDL
jgi:hypothetical protein